MLIDNPASLWLRIAQRCRRFRRSAIRLFNVRITPHRSVVPLNHPTEGLRIIRIAEDFGWTLDDRDNGPRSGKAFRDNVLLPALNRSYRVRVVIDGPTYSMAFLNEAFGGLVRSGHLSAQELNERLDIAGSAGYRYTKLAAERYIRQAGLMK
jgi:hypothetical protein